jgi:hypothetical protein
MKELQEMALFCCAVLTGDTKSRFCGVTGSVRVQGVWLASIDLWYNFSHPEDGSNICIRNSAIFNHSTVQICKRRAVKT